MTAIGVPIRSNQQRYNFIGTTVLVNAYAEQTGKDAKGPITPIGCDGTLTFGSVTDVPLRGMIYLEDLDILYAVFSSSVYKVEFDGTTVTTTRIGSIPGTDTVQMVRNQKATPQTGVLAGGIVYCIENDAITIVDDVDLPSTVQSIAQQGGYTIYGISDGRFFISSINEMTAIDGTDFATAEQSPDKLIRVWADRGELFIMGQKTIEPWRNTGNTDFPFETLINQTIPRGIMAANSVASFDNSFGWVGNNGVVYRLNGYTPTRISTHEVERAISDSSAQEDIIGFSWSRRGHEFYTISDNLTFTYTYDAATQIWHQRKSLNSEFWRHRFTVEAWSRIIVGDGNGGTLYYFDSDTYTEAGDVLPYKVRFPPMHTFPNGAIVDALQFEMAVGYGLVSTTAQGYDPQVMLRIYKDGGNSVAFERFLPLGKRGKYKNRVETRRLGKYGQHGMVIELEITDPVPRALALSDAKVRPLSM